MSASEQGRRPARRRGLRAWIARYLRSERAAVSPILVLSLVPIIGALGMGVEGSNWWLTQRAVQNAADTAAMAADWNTGATAAGSKSGNGFSMTYSTTGCATSPGDFDCDAVAAAAKAGFTNGSANVVVYPQHLTSGCPSSLSSCYEVTVIKKLPVYLLGIVGFSGDTTISSGSAQAVEAIAYAGTVNVTAPNCIVSTATSGVGLQTNGAPKVALQGCNIAASSTSNPSATCNGSNLGANNYSSPGTDNGCGVNHINGATAPSTTTIQNMSSNIPADPCGGQAANYPQESGTLPSSNTPSVTLGGKTYSGGAHPGYVYFCGDVKLSGNVSISTTTVVVIYNGQLDLNNFTLSTASATGATLIFAGMNSIGSVTPFHNFTDNSSSGKGVIDIEAPTNDSTATTYNATWHGVAIYQSPFQVDGTGVLTTALADEAVTKKLNSLDIAAAGSSPTLDLTGIMYLPNAALTMSGAIDQSSFGFQCFLLVANTVQINGNGSIFKNPQTGCNQAGATQITTNILERVLVG